MSFVLLYIFASILAISIIGYGFLITKFINLDSFKLNIGIQGLFGIFFLTFISYLTIFFTKHGYLHNMIIHLIGLFSFLYFFDLKKRYSELIKLFTIFTILFIGLLIIRNHDDFSYYHLTYSLGLTENKIFFGLGQFMHGYKHHSSLFLFNSIIYLPVIKYYLFHSLGWFTLLFINYFIIDYLFFKKIKELNFEYFFYLIILLVINFKFSRIGAYGTDLSAQIILLFVFPLIYQTLTMKINDLDFKSNIATVMLLITYATSLKSFFVLNFLFFFPFLLFFNFKNIIKHFLFTKIFAISIFTIFLITSVNTVYTGCLVYPVKQTCIEDSLSWSLSKKHVEKMNNHYQLWAKSGFGLSSTEMGMKPEKYITKFHWLPHWYKTYFQYKFKETLIVGGIIILFFIILFKKKNTNNTNNFNAFLNFKISIFFKNFKIKNAGLSILYLIALALFIEWFYNRPALRYGGYFLLYIILFAPLAKYLSLKKFKLIDKKKTIISIVIFSLVVFNVRNVLRINKEFKIVPNNNFPFFYAPVQSAQEFTVTNSLNRFKKTEIKGTNAKLYKPNTDGCWVVKTPCIGDDAKNIIVKEKFGFKIFISNQKEIKKLKK